MIKFKTTFKLDFDIANKFGVSAVKDTYKEELQFCNDDYELIGELIIITNWMAWQLYEELEQCESTNNNLGELVTLYSNLYYATKHLFFEKFEDNQVAIDYYYNFID